MSRQPHPILTRDDTTRRQVAQPFAQTDRTKGTDTLEQLASAFGRVKGLQARRLYQECVISRSWEAHSGPNLRWECQHFTNWVRGVGIDVGSELFRWFMSTAFVECYYRGFNATWNEGAHA